MTDIEKKILKTEIRGIIANYNIVRATDEIILLITRERTSFKEKILNFIRKLNGENND